VGFRQYASSGTATAGESPEQERAPREVRLKNLCAVELQTWQAPDIASTRCCKHSHFLRAAGPNQERQSESNRVWLARAPPGLTLLCGRAKNTLAYYVAIATFKRLFCATPSGEPNETAFGLRPRHTVGLRVTKLTYTYVYQKSGRRLIIYVLNLPCPLHQITASEIKRSHLSRDSGLQWR